MSSLLITNDFPPKLGGIQTYLGEVWRRLAPTDPIILAPTVAGCAEHDAEFPAEIIRLPHRVLLPTPELRRRVRALIAERDPSMVFIDPIMPLGMIGPGNQRLCAPAAEPRRAAAHSQTRVGSDRQRRLPCVNPALDRADSRALGASGRR